MQKSVTSASTAKPSCGTNVVSGSSLTNASSQLSNSALEKNKQWQRELLMERIRSHATQHKSFAELSKSMRMSMLEKRYALDTVEKSNLQKCLDSMQHCIKVTSRQGLVERLESLSRQLGLKFMEDTSGLFISTDMFYLEIMLDAAGSLTDVKVHHECKIEQQSCSELVNCLNRGDFADFTTQLEGLSSIYQLNAEPKVKKKAFVALQSMETDLYNLYQIQNFSKDTQQCLVSSTVGLVLKRRGGHPMKLTYFVAPYDLISLTEKCLQPLSLDLISSKDIGMSVTVNLEAASANKLQILPTVTFAKDVNGGIETPVYAPLTQLNSTLLPATFVLRLNKPLPVCSATLRALLPAAAAAAGTTAGSENTSTTATVVAHEQKSSNACTTTHEISATIMNLIVQTASAQQLKNSAKGLFVCLPDQTHCYFFTDNKQLKATLISSIPFTEPAQVPIILSFLKKQALFYTLLSSCVRPQAKMGNDMDTTTILEVNAISFQQISVSLQHSFEESMATVEFNLNDSSVSCYIYASTHNYDLLSIKLTKIVQKSLSIPITIRALLKFWEQERMKIYQRSIGGGGGSNTVGNAGGSGGSNGNAPQPSNTYGNYSTGMGGGPNDAGGSGGCGGGVVTAIISGGGNISAVTKQEDSAIQRSFIANTNNAVNATTIAGYLKFKAELIKKEDFHENPKNDPQTQLQSIEAKTLGAIINAQQQQQTSDIAMLPPTDLDLADKYTSIWKDKTNNLKNSVSITPIMHGPPNTETSNVVLNSASNLEIKRTGIEIIPLLTQNVGPINSSNSNNSNMATIAASNSSNIPSTGSTTITITPISSAVTQQSISKNDKKLSSCSITATTATTSAAITSKRNLVDITSSSSASTLLPSTEQKEKKRSKKKRDDSPMGPPEKVFSRQNSPATIANSGAADVVARKFSSPSSSPKGGSGGSNNNCVGISSRPSPKHSPVYTSPKHQSTASNSPKSPFGTHSPKHGSSGKPSMSTLKSAAANLSSPKGDKNVTCTMAPSVCVGGSGGVTVTTAAVTAAAAVTGNNANIAAASALSRSLTNAGIIGNTSVNSIFAMGTASKVRDKEKITTTACAAVIAKTAMIAAAPALVTPSAPSLQQLKNSAALNSLPTTMGSNVAPAGTFGTVGVSIGGSNGGGMGKVATAASLDAVMRKAATITSAFDDVDNSFNNNTTTTDSQSSSW